MEKRLLELAVEIVHAQVSLGKMSGEEIEAVLIRVYNALHKMQKAEEGESAIGIEGESHEVVPGRAEAPSMPDARASIQEDKVTCLECGAEFRQLTANHLRTHQLTPKEYKRKWGFPLKQSLAARVLTKLRSRSAKKRGLPQKLQQYLEAQRQKKQALAAETPGETKPVLRRPKRTGVA